MENRANFGKMEVWCGGQVVLYSKDGFEMELFPIEPEKGDHTCPCGEFGCKRGCEE